MKRWRQNLQILARHPRVLARGVTNVMRSAVGQIRLRGVDIELTNTCPCSCAHCYADSLPTLSTQMPLVMLEAVADQAVALGALNVNLTGGEPLVRRDLEVIVTACASRGLFTVLCTSAAGLTEDRLRALHAAGLHGISFSLDSADATTHDQSRGIAGLYARVWQQLRVARQLGLYVAINTVATRTALHTGDLERLRSLALAERVILNLTMPSPTGRWRERRDVVLQPDDRARLAAFMAREGVRTDTDSTLGAARCPAGMQKLVVDPTGTIKPCQLLDVGFGSMRDGTLAEAHARMCAHSFAQQTYEFCPAADVELGCTQTEIYARLGLIPS